MTKYLILGLFLTSFLMSNAQTTNTIQIQPNTSDMIDLVTTNSTTGEINVISPTNILREVDLGTNLALPLVNEFKDARFNPNFAARVLFSTSSQYSTFSMPLEIATQSINPELGLNQSFLYYIQPERSTFMIRLIPTYRSKYLFSPNIKLPNNCTFILEGDMYYMTKVFATNKSTIFDTRPMSMMQGIVRGHFLWQPDPVTYIDFFAGICFIDVVSGRSRFNEVFLPGATSGHIYVEGGFRSSFPAQKLVVDLQFIVIGNELNKLLAGDTIIYPNIRISVNKDLFKFN